MARQVGAGRRPEPRNHRIAFDADSFKRILNIVVDWPPLWKWVWPTLIALLVLLSITDVTWNLPKPPSITIHATSTSVLFLALLWLPGLLRVLATFGGTLPTPWGDIQTRGLFDPLNRSVLGVMYNGLKRASDIIPDDEPSTRQVQAIVQQALLDRTPRQGASARLDELATQFDAAQTPDGVDDSTEMNAIVGSMLALAPDVYSSSQVNTLLGDANRLGRRMIGLASIEQSGDPQHFSQVLGIVQHAHSRHEYYWGLRALESMIPSLTADQENKLGRAFADIFPGAASTQVLEGKWGHDAAQLVERLRSTVRSNTLMRLNEVRH